MLAACGPDAVGNPIDVVREPRYLKRCVPAQFDVDPAFTPAERAEIEQAIADRAREDIIIEIVSPGSGHFIRGLPDFGDTSTGGGFYSNERFSIWIDSGNLPPGRTRTVAYAQIGGLAQNP